MRFPESTSEEETFRFEKTTPELEESRKQTFNLLASPKQRYYIEGRYKYYTLQRTILHENETMAKEIVSLSNQDATLKERNDDMQKRFRCMLVTTASQRFNVPISKIGALLDGRTQRTPDAAYDLLRSNADCEEFVKAVS